MKGNWQKMLTPFFLEMLYIKNLILLSTFKKYFLQQTAHF